MAMKNSFQIAYRTFFPVLIMHLLFLTSAASSYSFNATPVPVLVGERCKISCHDEDAGSLVIKVYETNSMDGPQIIAGYGNSNATEANSNAKNEWRSHKELQVRIDATEHTLNISFTVKPSDRNQWFTCVGVPSEPNETGVREQDIELVVESKPQVKDLFLGSMYTYEYGQDPYDRTTFVKVGKIITVMCELQIGIPNSEKYNISAPGEWMSDLKSYYGFQANDYGFKEGLIELDIKARIEDNGKPITCFVANRHGRATRTITMNVHYPVQSIKWSDNGVNFHDMEDVIELGVARPIEFLGEGNPAPKVTVRINNPRTQRWTRQDVYGLGKARLQTPANAELTAYSLTITAKNTVGGKATIISRKTTIVLVRSPVVSEPAFHTTPSSTVIGRRSSLRQGIICVKIWPGPLPPASLGSCWRSA